MYLEKNWAMETVSNVIMNKDQNLKDEFIFIEHLHRSQYVDYFSYSNWT